MISPASHQERLSWNRAKNHRNGLKQRLLSLLKRATGTKLGKDCKKNNLNNCSKWLAIEYKKLDRSLIVTVFLTLVLFLLVCEAYDIAKETYSLAAR